MSTNTEGARLVNASFASLLNAWLTSKSWTVARLASETQVKETTALGWVEGRQHPRTRNLLILKALGFDPSVRDMMPERWDGEELEGRFRATEAEFAKVKAAFDAEREARRVVEAELGRVRGQLETEVEARRALEAEHTKTNGNLETLTDMFMTFVAGSSPEGNCESR